VPRAARRSPAHWAPIFLGRVPSRPAAARDGGVHTAAPWVRAIQRCSAPFLDVDNGVPPGTRLGAGVARSIASCAPGCQDSPPPGEAQPVPRGATALDRPTDCARLWAWRPGRWPRYVRSKSGGPGRRLCRRVSTSLTGSSRPMDLTSPCVRCLRRVIPHRARGPLRHRGRRASRTGARRSLRDVEA
jgi:hypothetical protein